MRYPLYLVLMFISVTAFADLEQVSRSIAHNSKVDIWDGALDQPIVEILQTDVANKKFIFLGEPDHYFKEKFGYQLLFIEELLKLGHTHILAEIGVADGRKVQAYLETGNEDRLNEAGVHGYRYGTPPHNSDRNFTIEVKRFYRQLRQLKEKYPNLTYGGYDLDMYPGTAYLKFDQLFIDEGLSRYFVNRTKATEIRDLIEASKSIQSLLVRFQKIDQALSIINELTQEDISNDLDLLDLKFYTKVFRDSLEFRHKVTDLEFSWDHYVWRETKMFEITGSILSRENSEAKYILLGHNGHLMKTDEPNSEGFRYTSWDTIGAWITNQFPDSVYAIWSLIGKGEHSGHGCPNDGRCRFNAIPGTLEAELINLSPEHPLFFTNNETIKRHENSIITVINGEFPAKGSYGKMADAFYFIPEVTDVNSSED